VEGSLSVGGFSSAAAGAALPAHEVLEQKAVDGVVEAGARHVKAEVAGGVVEGLEAPACLCRILQDLLCVWDFLAGGPQTCPECH
jgi:hypothetical protein